VPVSANLESLTPDTTYHYRIVATNPNGTSFGADAKFTTQVNPPAAITKPAARIGQLSARLNATVNPEGGSVSDCHFEYGTSESYGTSIACSSSPGSGTSPVAVSADIAGLSAGTTYHYRIVATNAGGTGHGSDTQFTAATPQLPELGRCVKLAVANGKYSTTACTTKSTGENTGKYEWQPWPAAKNGFTTSGILATTIETVHKTTVKCSSGSLSGEFDGPQEAAMTIKLLGCEGGGTLSGKCQSEGAAAGELVMGLQARLGVIKTGTLPTLGWDLKPATGADLASFSCGATEVALTGSAIGQVTSVDKMSSTFTLKYKVSLGKQQYTKFEGGLNDTPSLLRKSGEEGAGLTLSAVPANEEAIEIKAIV
jgi:hypothetical protein